MDNAFSHNLDEVLAWRQLRFRESVSDADRHGLRSFWDDMRATSDDNLTSAEMDDVLATYVNMGVLEKIPAEPAESKPAPSAAPPTAAAKPPEPAVPESRTVALQIGDADPALPVILRIIVPKAEVALVEAALEQGLFGGFVREDDKFSFEFKDTHRMLHVLSVREFDVRFQNLLRDLANRHVGVELIGALAPADAAPAAADGTAAACIFHVRDVRAKRAIPTGDSFKPISPALLQNMVTQLRYATIQPRRKQRPRPPMLQFSRTDEVTEYLACMADVLPQNVRDWAYQNVNVIKDPSIGRDETRHATRALSLMLSVSWRSTYFEPIDPREARRILDEELFGLDEVKQRVVETVIQINRTHTLPFYGLLLVGPPGTGKSQIAYAVARILKLPWAVLDMSSIHDASALTGTSRVYTNAKPGRIMEALTRSGSSNMVFVINELDKAEDGTANGNPADALLTLFDNLGFTDNYVECAIPTSGIYPIATANDVSAISGPLLSRFALIRIDDYTPAEKRKIFSDYSLPKILRHIGMREGELALTDAAVDAVVSHYAGLPGVRELEQAAEHLAAHALYELELSGANHITLGEKDVCDLLGI